MFCFVYVKFEARLRQTFGDVTYKLPKVIFYLCSWLHKFRAQWRWNCGVTSYDGA